MSSDIIPFMYLCLLSLFGKEMPSIQEFRVRRCLCTANSGKSKHAWLQTFLALPHGIPSHDTFGRVFARLHPRRFQECLLSWTQAVAQLTQGTLVSLDG